MNEEPLKKRKKTKKNRRRSSAFTKANKKHCKIVVLGSAACGKTSLIKRFVEMTFSEDHIATVEDQYHRSYKYQGRHYTLKVTDMASPFQFPAMRDLHIQKAEIVLLVYEIDCQKSYNEALQTFKIARGLRPLVPVILIGTKQDVISLNRQNSDEYIESFYSDAISANGHILTSSKDNVGVKEAFEMALDELDKQKCDNEESEENISDSTFSVESSKCFLKCNIL